jgi:HK97 family phage major capsid protein
MVKYDFHGWATRNDLKCSDGRVIRRDAFKGCDGKIVPLVWNHRHDDPSNVLGHALLKNQEDGVYAYCTFNESEAGKAAKLLVEHGDISALSIFANQLKQEGSNVLHGDIKEVSLVLAGANPGASICNVVRHGEMVEDEADIYTGEDFILEHNSMNDFTEEQLAALKGPKGPKGDIGPQGPKGDSLKEEDKMASNEETVRDVFETLTEKQKTVVYALIGQALEDANDNDEEDGGENMKHNVFDNVDPETTMIHADDMQAILADARRTGSMREAVENFAQDRGCDSNSLFHADYGIENVGYLFPDDRSVTNEPIFVSRNMDWVSKLMNNIRHTPFSRIKSLFANITEDDARAKGYIKGNLKKEEVFTLLKRSTSPTTVYKKQKMDRDDVVDIVDLDVVAWIKKEMRIMLDEELARAILVGDGRVSSSDDKIDPIHIRPIWTDDDFYTIKQTVSVASSDNESTIAKNFIKQCIKARKNYKGSGNPTLYTTEDMLTDMLLLEDTTGRVIYESAAKLATTLRVKEIVTVPVMENLTRTDDNSKVHTLLGIIVNPNDYTIGADKGGAVNMFDDFDIDYNQQKYLIETRCSGALTLPYSAIAVEKVSA